MEKKQKHRFGYKFKSVTALSREFLYIAIAKFEHFSRCNTPNMMFSIPLPEILKFQHLHINDQNFVFQVQLKSAVLKKALKKNKFLPYIVLP